MAKHVPTPMEWRQNLRQIAKEWARYYDLASSPIHSVEAIGLDFVRYLRIKRPGDLYFVNLREEYDGHVLVLLWPLVSRVILEVFEASWYFRLPANERVAELLPGVKEILMRESDPGDDIEYRELYAELLIPVVDRRKRVCETSNAGLVAAEQRLRRAKALLPARSAA